MRKYISSTVFEIVENKFVYRGWDVRSDHRYHEEGPQSISFGNTGILLRIIDGEPKLDVPMVQNAALLQSDHAFNCGERGEGRFVEVRIY